MAPAAVPGLVEQLTSRELELLGMLAAGRSNQVIAGQLVVTLDTIKKHVSHLLGKLGAASRTEAADRARQLGLIPRLGVRSASPAPSCRSPTPWDSPTCPLSGDARRITAP